MVEVNARLQVLNGVTLEDLEITDDAASSTGRAMPVLDAKVRADLATALTTLADILASTDKDPDLTGTWGYAAGADGTETLTGDKRVIGIAAHATSAGSFTINGGDSVPIPANSSIEIQPIANLVDPTIIFVGTDSFFVEWVT